MHEAFDIVCRRDDKNRNHERQLSSKDNEFLFEEKEKEPPPSSDYIYLLQLHCNKRKIVHSSETIVLRLDIQAVFEWTCVSEEEVDIF